MEFIQPDMGEQQDPQDISPNMWDNKNYLEVLKHYSQDEIIPETLKKKEWAIFGKHLINTFLGEKDMPMIDIFSEILRIDDMMSKPPNRLTFNQTGDLDMMQVYMFLTSRRAIGIDKSKVNERVLQNTQILQNISTSEHPTKQSKLRSLL